MNSSQVTKTVIRSVSEIEGLVRTYIHENLFTKLERDTHEVFVELIFAPHSGYLMSTQIIPFTQFSSLLLTMGLKKLLKTKNVRYTESEKVRIRVLSPTPLERLRYLALADNDKL